MPTIEEALQHLGYDYTDAAILSNVTRSLRAADSYLRGAVGEDVWTLLPYDDLARELVLLYLDDLVSERGTSAKAGTAKRDMVHTMELQLRLRLNMAREAAQA